MAQLREGAVTYSQLSLFNLSPKLAKGRGVVPKWKTKLKDVRFLGDVRVKWITFLEITNKYNRRNMS